jgi:hypothetical protein
VTFIKNIDASSLSIGPNEFQTQMQITSDFYEPLIFQNDSSSSSSSQIHARRRLGSSDAFNPELEWVLLTTGNSSSSLTESTKPPPLPPPRGGTPSPVATPVVVPSSQERLKDSPPL